MRKHSDPTPAMPIYEFSVYLRWLHDGRPGPLSRRYFASASQTLSFLTALDAQREATFVTVARREVGSWSFVDRLALEAEAAGEVGR